MKYKLFIILFFPWLMLQAQILEGNFLQLKGNSLQLVGYNGIKEIQLAQTICDSTGHFKLEYPNTYKGAAIIQIEGASNLIVLLKHENFSMQWKDMGDYNTLQYSNSPENTAFAQGIQINKEAEKKLAALYYMLPLYVSDVKKHNWLLSEIAYQEKKFNVFINHLPATSYAKYYLTLRKFITDMSFLSNRYSDRLPDFEKQFNSFDFTDYKLLSSGLLNQLFEGYFELLNTQYNKELLTLHGSQSIESIFKTVSSQPVLHQEVGEYLFNFFEQRSMFNLSEYLALEMLDQNSCDLSLNQKSLFEQYCKLKIGVTAPDLVFNNFSSLNKISQIKANYKLVIFGASWCPSCQKEYLLLIDQYEKLKADGVSIEFFYFSLDKDKAGFDNFKDAPFKTFCDYKSWESPAVKEYYVSATPTMYLLNNDLKILSKIKNVSHLNAWLQFNLQQKTNNTISN